MFSQEEHLEQEVVNLRKENQTLVRKKRKLNLVIKNKEETIKQLEASKSRIADEKNHLTQKCSLLESTVKNITKKKTKVELDAGIKEETIKQLETMIRKLTEEKNQIAASRWTDTLVYRSSSTDPLVYRVHKVSLSIPIVYTSGSFICIQAMGHFDIC